MTANGLRPAPHVEPSVRAWPYTSPRQVQPRSAARAAFEKLLPEAADLHPTRHDLWDLLVYALVVLFILGSLAICIAVAADRLPA